ncbi:hypothetical protein TCON_1631 [Astathelohania contejeani]|uniref:CLASP N-terminal domain-containing protein n=1 Tax=Astathelohania contejeani TaxID=164912 RepID=A0ABQ7HYA4_9MICR|nr:hypothetical protein TCON_1631 [Thelohania contejeani]
MKQSSAITIDKLIIDGQSLQQLKEDELTWSKINTLFENLTHHLSSDEDNIKTINSLHKLIVRSMLSDRSRLSGTALSLLKKIIQNLDKKFTFSDLFIDPLVRLCGKSNRVFSMRSEAVLLEMAKFIPCQKYIALLKKEGSAVSRNIRLCVYKGAEIFFMQNQDIIQKKPEQLKTFRDLIAKGTSDAHLDARTVCKRLLIQIDGKPSEESVLTQVIAPTKFPRSILTATETSNQEKIKKTTSSCDYKPPLLTKKREITLSTETEKKEMEEKVVKNAEELKREIDSRFNYDKKFNFLRHSPLAKQLKFNKTPIKKMDLKVKKPEEEEKKKQEERKQNTLSHDDLTPLKLGKYLNDYKKETKYPFNINLLLNDKKRQNKEAEKRVEEKKIEDEKRLEEKKIEEETRIEEEEKKIEEEEKKIEEETRIEIEGETRMEEEKKIEEEEKKIEEEEKNNNEIESIINDEICDSFINEDIIRKESIEDVFDGKGIMENKPKEEIIILEDKNYLNEKDLIANDKLSNPINNPGEISFSRELSQIFNDYVSEDQELTYFETSIGEISSRLDECSISQIKDMPELMQGTPMIYPETLNLDTNDGSVCVEDFTMIDDVISVNKKVFSKQNRKE